MGRHVFAQSAGAQSSPLRRQVSVVRRDLLLEGETVNPRTGEVLDLPKHGRDQEGMPNGALVGPSVSLSLVRRVVPAHDLPAALREQAKARAGGTMPQYVAVWSLLDLADLWRRDPPPPPREPSSKAEDDVPLHPFDPRLVTGGSPRGDHAPDGWVAVRKTSTVWIADGAFRLAAAMHGSADDGAEHIGRLGAEAWERDVERCFALHALVAAAPYGLLETDEVLALRPVSSVSQEVERQVLDAALRWLGVDPGEEMRRTPGRRKRAGEDGNVVVVDVDGEGRVHGHLRRAYGGHEAGTALTDMPPPRLVEMLGRLRTDRLGSDADLLEAYLDAAHPAWREEAAGEPPDAASATDPWDVLGIPRGASREEVTAAYRRLMMKIHPDTGGLPPWMSWAVSDAYRALKDVAAPAREDA